MKKLTLGTALLMAMLGAAIAEPSFAVKSKLRFADAAADACMANCANQNASCKRVCPVTFSTPCLTACDSQMQTCTQGCQKR
jgi:hypothetical protein